MTARVIVSRQGIVTREDTPSSSPPTPIIIPSSGAPGQDATITVGTTTTGDAGSSASVANSGTSSAAVLNFTIPRGADGADGAIGPQGIQGDPGGTFNPDWSFITGTPTTVAGYGIADAYTKTQSDGRFAPLGSGGSGISTTHDLFIASVTEYGALGDGSDDSAAITAAHTAAYNSSTGGILYFPPPPNFYGIASEIEWGADRVGLMGALGGSGGFPASPPQITWIGADQTAGQGVFRMYSLSGSSSTTGTRRRNFRSYAKIQNLNINGQKTAKTVSAVGVGGTTITITTSSVHGMQTGDRVRLSDGGGTDDATASNGFSANPPKGTYTVTVISPTQFTYTVTTAPTGTYTSGLKAVANRNRAMHGIICEDKLDFSGGFLRNVSLGRFRGNALRVEAGAINLHLQDCRFDRFADYAVYWKLAGGDNGSLSGITSDNNRDDQPDEVNIGRGLLEVDCSDNVSSALAHIKIEKAKLEVNTIMPSTEAVVKCVTGTTRSMAWNLHFDEVNVAAENPSVTASPNNYQGLLFAPAYDHVHAIITSSKMSVWGVPGYDSNASILGSDQLHAKTIIVPSGKYNTNRTATNADSGLEVVGTHNVIGSYFQYGKDSPPLLVSTGVDFTTLQTLRIGQWLVDPTEAASYGVNTGVHVNRVVNEGTVGTLSATVTITAQDDTNRTLTVDTVANLRVGAYIRFPLAAGGTARKQITKMMNTLITYSGSSGVVAATGSSNTIILEPPTFDLNTQQLVQVRSAAPTTGAWKVNDLVLNSAPVAGGIAGWICTNASPVTFVPFARLDSAWTKGTPTIAVNANAGTGASATLTNADDLGGRINLTLGSGSIVPNALAATITFSGSGLPSAPRNVIIAPGNGAAARLLADGGNTSTAIFMDAASLSATSFSLKMNISAPAASTSMQWYYHVYLGDGTRGGL